jgi:RNA polymerase sigma factor (TIGR02999 family)
MTDTPTADAGRVTELLARIDSGDADAFDRLFPLVYGHLHQAAERVLRGERPGHTLQPTALVHEAYLKLAGSGPLPSRDRSHFLGLAARAMRQILVDHARRRRAGKRGGGVRPATLDGDVRAPAAEVDELLALDDSLNRLGQVSDRLRRVVELRFFAGLSDDDVAETLGVTTRTVQRDWAKARAWLYRDMDGADRGAADGG